MKINTLLLLTIILYSFSTQAQEEKSKWYHFGTIAGVGYACNAPSLKKYEEIVAFIIQGEITSPKLQDEALRDYSKAKFNSSEKQRNFPPMSCKEATQRFEQQQIFATKFIDNNTIQTPDGKIIKIAIPEPTKIETDKKTSVETTTENQNKKLKKNKK